LRVTFWGIYLDEMCDIGGEVVILRWWYECNMKQWTFLVVEGMKFWARKGTWLSLEKAH